MSTSSERVVRPPNVMVQLRRQAGALIHEVQQREWDRTHRADGDPFDDELARTRDHIAQLQDQLQQVGAPRAGDPLPGTLSRWRLARTSDRLQDRWRRLRARISESSRADHEARRLQQLRMLRTEVHDLRTVLGHVRAGRAALLVFADFVGSSRTQVNALFDTITRDAPDLKFDDELAHLKDLWRQIEVLLAPVPSAAQPAPDEPARLEMIDGLCHDMIATIGWRTIPDRLNSWLSKAWPGTAISFHEVFQDELPDLADRQRLLNFMSFAPRKLENALVDVGTGLVYKYHRERWKRWSWVSLLAVAFAAATIGVVWIGGKILASAQPARWGNDSHQYAVIALWWAGLCGGVLFHTAADSMKRARAGGTGSATGFAVGHVTHWISAHVNTLALRLVTMVVGTVGAFALLSEQLDPSKSSTLFTMFLVGYGLDSFVDIFVKTADQRATALGTALIQQLGAGAATQTQWERVP
jgi:hypothetical protein